MDLHFHLSKFQGRQGKTKGMVKLEYLLEELVGEEVKEMWEF